MPAAHQNPHATAARTRKASLLVEVARASGMTPEQAVRATAHQRSLAAQIAGVCEPSDETWAVVVELLRSRRLAGRSVA